MTTTITSPLLACALLLATLAGCNSHSDSLAHTPDLPGKPVDIAVALSGIESFAAAPDEAPAATRSPFAPDARTLHTQVQPLGGDGRLLITTLRATEPAAATRASITTTLPQGTTLRVAAFDALGKFVDDCQYVVVGNSGALQAQNGESLTVPVRATPYTFYCYTPGTCPINFNRIDVMVVVGANDEFAYAKTTALVDGSSSLKTITLPALTYKVAKVKLAAASGDRGVVCKARLLGAMIPSPGAFDLPAGYFSSAWHVQTKHFDHNNDEVVFPINAAEGSLIENAKLEFTDLSVAGLPVKVKSIALPNFTLKAGTQYTIDVEVYHPSGLRYIKVTNAGLKVAMGNLMRFNGTGYWYLAPDQAYYTGHEKGGDYFCWGIANPTLIKDETGTSIAEIDKGCAAVLGKGWRMPTKQELLNLAASGNVWGTYTSRGGVKNGRYFGTTSVPGNQDDYLFLPAAGYRENSMQAVPYIGCYWSSTMHTVESSTIPFAIDLDQYDCGDLFNMAKTDGLTIRCVAPLN